MAEKARLTEKALNELRHLSGGPVLEDEPMSAHTTFRLGGPADYMCSPKGPDELGRVLAWCESEGLERLVIGAGSNLLVADKGIRGLVIRTGAMTAWSVSADTLVAEAGILMPAISFALADMGLSGFTEACGIPGSLGGGLCMNAGAYGWNIADVTVKVEAMDLKGRRMELSREAMGFGPKTSALMREGLIATRLYARLGRADRAAIKARISALLKDRASKQPLELPNAGCVFRNPAGTGAGRLIDSCGLKGLCVGGAWVSEKHANFIVNRGGASAADVRSLLMKVQGEVFDKYGEVLEPEVRLVGDWDAE
ncbi:MAG TPA: UDP-N-acetylmuramate dehydrogenase [Bacillota bacterium]|nr:UDP-N-acetylmuramate dehydrogenase [Bacillota bacterium]